MQQQCSTCHGHGWQLTPDCGSQPCSECGGSGSITIPDQPSTPRSFAARYPTFERWMKAINRAVIMASGASVYDLADQPFTDWYESEMDPAEAAAEALADEGFPFGLPD